MEALIGLLKDISSVQVILQIFVGGAAMMLIGHMVVRARGDRAVMPAVPPPTTPTIADIPPPFLQGPREAVELLREIRDYCKRKAGDGTRTLDLIRSIKDEAKQRTEEVAQIADLIRTSSDHLKRQVDILDRIDREQSAENRAASARRRAGD